MTDRRRKWDIALLCLYGAVMLWLLFHREPDSGGIYWELVRARVSLEPFVTIRRFWRLMFSEQAYLVRWGVANIVGNVVMFVPMGILFPMVFSGLRRFWKTFLVSGLVMTAVEILQMLLLVGFCDIDDLILNLAGVTLGYGLYRLANREKT